MIAARYRILNACNIVDVPIVLQIMEENASVHLAQESQQSSTDSITTAPIIPPSLTTPNISRLLGPSHSETSPFLEATRAISSLRNYGPQLVELRNTFFQMGQTTDPIVADQLHSKMSELTGVLAAACSDEDRPKFFLAIEVGRATNKLLFLKN
ncbi:hypothetical protein BC830DRAFT_338929 [Chytriomyces sp. MP71]|nr:hypothetical protein BC830DRAFT_338929 [Chytriomyces sp. MP71]